jgi:hypothetical protein
VLERHDIVKAALCDVERHALQQLGAAYDHGQLAARQARVRLKRCRRDAVYIVFRLAELDRVVVFMVGFDICKVGRHRHARKRDKQNADNNGAYDSFKFHSKLLY